MVLKGASLVLITGFDINWKCRSLSLRQIEVRVISPTPSAPLLFLTLFPCLSHIFVLIVFSKPRWACTNPSTQHNHQ